MAKLPTFKRIVKEDFSAEEQAIVEKMGFLINGNFEPVYNSLNKGLSIADNLNQQIVTITVKVDANGKIISTSEVRTNVSGSIQGLIPIFCSPSPVAAPWVTWEQTSANLLKLRNISGLVSNSSYLLKFLILGS